MTSLMPKPQWLPRIVSSWSGARLAIVMYSTPNIVEYSALAARINQRYASEHGYDFVHHVASENVELPMWDKVGAIREVLTRYDAVFFIDSDAIFNDHGKALDFLLKDKADFAACSDHPNGPYLANAGTLFIRNTPWSRELIDSWWAMRRDPTYHSWAFEQSALDTLLRADTSGRLRIYPATEFNSIAHEITEGRRDTFVLHFMGTSSEYRRSELLKQLQRFESPEAVRSRGPAGEPHAALQNVGSTPYANARLDQRAVGDWLIHCADPVQPLTAPPQRSLCPQAARALAQQADMHGIVGSLLRHFPPFQRDDATFAAARSDATVRHRSAVAYSLMLRTHGEAIMDAASATGLPLVMMKGPVFARTIYPSPNLRTFTDIDLLIAPQAEPRLAQILDQHGFRLAHYDRDPVRQEWKWIKRDNDALMIEVHTNMVHHPELRAAMSVTFEDLAGIAETPAALLTVALIHGALHRFERLRQIVDICQAARQVRTTEEEGRFEHLVHRTGSRFAAIAGLDLAYRVLNEPHCRKLADGLGPMPLARLMPLLIGRSVVTSTMSQARFFHSWRRQAFRALLKRPAL